MLEIWEWRGKLSLNDNLNMTSKHIVGLRIGTNFMIWFNFDSQACNSILLDSIMIQSVSIHKKIDSFDSSVGRLQ